MDEQDVVAKVSLGRTIRGHSAVLVPCTREGDFDWDCFESHVGRTHAAGLTPAVNMDTGYVHLLDDGERARILDITAAVTAGAFDAGAYVSDRPGAAFDLDGHVRAAEAIATRGGTPVIFPSHGLNALDETDWVAALGAIGDHLDRFIAFELGPMFIPHGRIVSLDAYEAMMQIPSCVGAKHSSLSRVAEWERLALRDRHRPDFSVLTGNDLAIDMVMYGSDYLLGLSTFAPAAFAARDALWTACDARFHELNDLLQYLGHFVFRPPVPAYRHDAAMFLELRGWASSGCVPSGSERRPDSDRGVLADIAQRLDEWA
jgi:dihydrodipicolinate synthase/N-acetylneuraminate lyase